MLEMDGSWPKVRRLVDLKVPCGVWPLVIWHLDSMQKVSTSIIQAGEAYQKERGCEPDLVLIKTLPLGAEEFLEIRNMTLVVADWIPDGFIVVAKTGTTRIDKEYQRWQKI